MFLKKIFLFHMAIHFITTLDNKLSNIIYRWLDLYPLPYNLGISLKCDVLTDISGSFWKQSKHELRFEISM